MIVIEIIEQEPNTQLVGTAIRSEYSRIVKIAGVPYAAYQADFYIFMNAIFGLPFLEIVSGQSISYHNKNISWNLNNL